MNSQYDRRDRTVHVSRMYHLVDTDFIYDLFSQVGFVEKVVLREYSDGSPKNALVVFKDIESVTKAVRYLHKMDVFGEQLLVQPFRGSPRARQKAANTNKHIAKSERCDNTVHEMEEPQAVYCGSSQHSSWDLTGQSSSNNVMNATAVSDHHCHG